MLKMLTTGRPTSASETWLMKPTFSLDSMIQAIV